MIREPQAESRANKGILFRTLLVIFVVVLALSCASTGVNKGQFNLISVPEEWEIGKQLKTDIGEQLPLLDDAQSLKYLRDIGMRVVARTEMAQLPWDFHIVISPDINAFNIPGGHVYFNSALIRAADTEMEFVGVLAHEVSHGVARHGTENLSKAYGFQIISVLALGEDPETYQEILAGVTAGGILSHYSREAERESDALGAGYMFQAGIKPEGMIAFFHKLLDARQRRPGSMEMFFASHPLTEERIENITDLVAAFPPKPGLTIDSGAFQRFRERVSRLTAKKEEQITKEREAEQKKGSTP